jgi:hypothetical protein
MEALEEALEARADFLSAFVPDVTTAFADVVDNDGALAAGEAEDGEGERAFEEDQRPGIVIPSMGAGKSGLSRIGFASDIHGVSLSKNQQAARPSTTGTLHFTVSNRSVTQKKSR